jgi:hypothetical protein
MTAMGDKEEKVALSFIAALMAETPDAELYEATATAQHNFDAEPGPIQAGFKSIRFIRKFVPDFRFDDVRVHSGEGSCTLQYLVRGTLPGGRLEAPTCMVLTFSDAGRIATLDEYIDTNQLKSLTDLMAAGPPA